MKETFGIKTANTKRKRDMGKRKGDQKVRFQPLELGGRVLDRNLTERGKPGKKEHFGNRKCIKTLKRKTKMV